MCRCTVAKISIFAAVFLSKRRFAKRIGVWGYNDELCGHLLGIILYVSDFFRGRMEKSIFHAMKWRYIEKIVSSTHRSRKNRIFTWKNSMRWVYREKMLVIPNIYGNTGQCRRFFCIYPKRYYFSGLKSMLWVF